MGHEQLNIDEHTAFKFFAEVAGLLILDGAVQRRPPPEPDILCQLSSGEYVGFEVTEACSPKNIRFWKNAIVLGGDLRSAYENLPLDLHTVFRTRFAGHAMVAIMPTNKQLLDPGLDRASDVTRGLLQKWGKLHAVRSTLGLVASFIFLWLAIRA